MTQKPRTLVVTTALPYANGPLHLGHLLEQIQADIWVRFQRLQGHRLFFFCAEDAHGTPIMVNAQRQGISPEQLIEEMQQRHRADSNGFSISFDHYYTTHSSHNQQLLETLYQRLQAQGLIHTQTIQQLYDLQQQQFLPDRFIQGECPRCQAADQYGDCCEQCGATYDATELGNPRSTLSGEIPVLRQTDHRFFDLPACSDWLATWTRSGVLPKPVANKLQEWFASGLKPWDITRDAPYFGFKIPDAPEKYFYVWLDAPIGYMATCQHFCQQHPEALNFEQVWQPDSPVELYHFVGKDIVYFHSLFWPAVLQCGGFRLPTQIFVHGFVTVDGAKMSKSRGTFLQAATFLQHIEADCLRYYLAAKSDSGIDDLDLQLTELMQRVNSELVNKVVNLAARCASFLNKRFANQLTEQLIDPELHQRFLAAEQPIAEAYHTREFAKAIRQIQQLADRANAFIDQHAPWQLIKQSEQHSRLQAISSQGIHCFRLLMTYLKPVTPELAARAEQLLKGELSWSSIQKPWVSQEIAPFTPLLKRIEPAQIEALLAAITITKPAITENTTAAAAPAIEAIADTIPLEIFSQVDLRVARILQAEAVPNADKLIKLLLDIGGETRQIFAGIKTAYQPEQLVGCLTVMVANLAPRKMRFGLSEGMVLAAGPGGQEIFLLQPDSGAKPGMRVK
ncbi:MAG: methionine--tRNA ligase [Candidatus Symbiodolus clandestinus]